jgi:hypothetical protein
MAKYLEVQKNRDDDSVKDQVIDLIFLMYAICIKSALPLHVKRYEVVNARRARAPAWHRRFFSKWARYRYDEVYTLRATSIRNGGYLRKVPEILRALYTLHEAAEDLSEKFWSDLAAFMAREELGVGDAVYDTLPPYPQLDYLSGVQHVYMSLMKTGLSRWRNYDCSLTRRDAACCCTPMNLLTASVKPPVYKEYDMRGSVPMFRPTASGWTASHLTKSGIIYDTQRILNVENLLDLSQAVERQTPLTSLGLWSWASRLGPEFLMPNEQMGDRETLEAFALLSSIGADID